MYLGTALRQIHRLFSEGTVDSLNDERLLDRFVASHDDVAFAVLVERHGPMVLATCRAVLKDAHDAEDAFQATFLVLARKARSVRGPSGLGGWLHRVAYRVALRADATERRHRRREFLPEEDIPVAITDITLDEIRPALHEEIERLPESYRIPVVLCFLEGMTHRQAAAQLNRSEAGVRNRLTKALDLLKLRLTRRGLAPSVVVLAALARESTAATLPASLVTATTRAAVAFATGSAMTGTVSVAVTGLANRALRTVFWTKLKVGSALLAIASLAGVSTGLIAAGPSGKSRENSPPPATAIAQAPTPAARPVSPSKDKEVETVEIRGHVVGPDGRPLAGATVRTNLRTGDDPKDLEALSEADGRYLLRMPRSLRGFEDYVHVVASAPGYGLGVAGKVFRTEDITVRLVEDRLPIEGRIIDIEGRPVVGATIKTERVLIAQNDDLSPWIEATKDKGFDFNTMNDLSLIPMTATATSGPDGRFRLEGIGPNRIAELYVSGPTIVTTQLYVMTREGTALRTGNRYGKMMGPHQFIFQPRRFDLAVAPCKPIVGTVRDKDTGQPISGVKLRAAPFDENSFISAAGVEVTTDAQGHYTLTALPKASAYRLFVSPGSGQPYPNATFRAPADSPGLESVTFDIALKRGLLIRGRVTDKVTGQPVLGYVNAFTLHDNPAASDYPGYRQSYPSHQYIHKDGRFEIVGLPGRNLIACRAEPGAYRGYHGAESIQGYDPKHKSFATLPQPLHVSNYHAIAEITPDPKAEAATLDLQVDPGRTLKLSVVDPEGRPLGDTSAAGVTELFSSSTFAFEQGSSTIEVSALDPSKPRRVIVTHKARKLIGSVYLKGDESSPLTLRLQPWGTITGRIIDDEGRPRSGMSLRSVGASELKGPEVQGILPGGDFNAGIAVGKDGRFRVENLVPGLKYGASAGEGFVTIGELFEGVSVAAGEVKDLSDLKVTPLKRNN